MEEEEQKLLATLAERREAVRAEERRLEGLQREVSNTEQALQVREQEVSRTESIWKDRTRELIEREAALQKRVMELDVAAHESAARLALAQDVEKSAHETRRYAEAKERDVAERRATVKQAEAQLHVKDETIRGQAHKNREVADRLEILRTELHARTVEFTREREAHEQAKAEFHRQRLIVQQAADTLNEREARALRLEAQLREDERRLEFVRQEIRKEYVEIERRKQAMGTSG